MRKIKEVLRLKFGPEQLYRSMMLAAIRQQQSHIFVAVLGASSYTYAAATSDEQLASWIGAHFPTQ